MREEEVADKSRNIQVTVLQWQRSPAETFLRTCKRTENRRTCYRLRCVVWRYHGKQRYRSLVIQYTGKNVVILVEKRKVIFKIWCSTTQKWQKLVTAMHHKSYSPPEPQCRSRWKKLALFFSFTTCFYCFSCRLMCADMTKCANFLIRKVICGWKHAEEPSNHWNRKMPRLRLVADVINHYDEVIQSQLVRSINANNIGNRFCNVWFLS